MKYWEKLLKSIFEIPARKPVQKFESRSIELFLKKSLHMLDAESIDKLKTFIRQQQTGMGGFADRAGKCDLYYSLFGCYVAESLELQDVIPALKNYTHNVVHSCDLKNVHLHTASILYAKLFGEKNFPNILREKIHRDLLHSENKQQAYSGFMNMLTFYYLKDYFGLYNMRKRLKNLSTRTEIPCSVLSAMIVLLECFGKPVEALEMQLDSMFLKNGSFKAIARAPTGDLLSTAVALYALRFADYDIRIIAPDCLGFIDSLFSGGGFCATEYDVQPDVEYTFYGLLALGSLSG
jgi:hypothetical protein